MIPPPKGFSLYPQETLFEDILEVPEKPCLYHATTPNRCSEAILEACGEQLGCNPVCCEIAYRVGEDFAVMDYDGIVQAIAIAFPSRWRPESLLGKDFKEIHGPVPHFAENPEANRKLLNYVKNSPPLQRFLWTLSPDDELDHHPDRWEPNGPMRWLRVERQVTHPFKEGFLFVLQTRYTALRTMGLEERKKLVEALDKLSPEMKAYKGLVEANLAFD